MLGNEIVLIYSNDGSVPFSINASASIRDMLTSRWCTNGYYWLLTKPCTCNTGHFGTRRDNFILHTPHKELTNTGTLAYLMQHSLISPELTDTPL